MKFLCIKCDQAMRLAGTAGPDADSLTVTFSCPACGHRIAMLTNPWETQLVQTLGVKVGGRAAPAAPFEQVRSRLAGQRDGVFVDESTAVASAASEGPGCPFAAMIPAADPAASAIAWTPEAEVRADRIPAFIRPMARQAIERFARERGYDTITDAVMDEARGFMGM
jgi:DNA-directed RNA polymerase subunit RPC12/RpoP